MALVEVLRGGRAQLGFSGFGLVLSLFLKAGV